MPRPRARSSVEQTVKRLPPRTTLRTLILLAVTLAATAAVPAPASAVRMTHTVSIAGQLVNNWTIDDPEECGPVGAGTFTVNFRSTQTRRVLPLIDPYQRAETGGYKAWVVYVPLGRHLKGMPDLRSSGSVTRVDNTTRRPRDGTPCSAADKSRCGTFPLGKSFSGFGRYDRRRITVGLTSQPFEYSAGDCLIGDLSLWSTPALAGGAKNGDVIVRMPKPSTLKRRRVVRVTGTSHKRTTYRDPYKDNPETVTNDITRTATITFRRR